MRTYHTIQGTLLDEREMERERAYRKDRVCNVYICLPHPVARSREAVPMSDSFQDTDG